MGDGLLVPLSVIGKIPCDINAEIISLLGH